MAGSSAWVYVIPYGPTKAGKLKTVVLSQPAPLSRGAARPRSCPPKKLLASADHIRLRAPSPGPNGAVADSLDEAKAAFRAAGSARYR